MNKQSKIQSLIIRHLMDHGSLDIRLPDGIMLEIGITQMDKNGLTVKSNDYCFVAASRDHKKTLLDSYNLGIVFEDEENVFVFEETLEDDCGRNLRQVSVV